MNAMERIIAIRDKFPDMPLLQIIYICCADINHYVRRPDGNQFITDEELAAKIEAYEGKNNQHGSFPIPKRFPVQALRLEGGLVECHEDDTSCPFTRECANHCTAGDFRSESGMTPNLRLAEFSSPNQWYCSKQPDDDGAGIQRIKR